MKKDLICLRRLNLDTIAKIIILFLAFFYLFLLDNSPPLALSDAENYILLAKSLSLGQGYRQIWSPGIVWHTKHPFFFPLILSPIIFIFGYNFLMMKLFSVIMAVISLYLVYVLFKRISDNFMALLILVLSGFSAQIVFFSQKALAEISYLLFSLLAIIFIEKYRHKKRIFNINLFFAMFFILATYFTRIIGLSLVIAVLLYFLFEPRFSEKGRDKGRPNQNLWASLRQVTVLGILLCIPILLWELRNYQLKGINGLVYFQELVSPKNPLNVELRWGFFERIIHCIYAYVFYAYPKILIAIQFTQRNPIAFILTAITFYGFVYCLIKKRTVIEYYIVFYMLILFSWIWSISSGARFVTPIVPFIFYYFIVGSKNILGAINATSAFKPSSYEQWSGESGVKLKGPFKKKILIFLVGISLFFNIKESFLFIVNKKCLNGYSQSEINNFLEMAEWVKNNTPLNSILASFVDSQLYLYFGRKAIALPYTDDAFEILDTIYNNRVNYIVVITIYYRTIKYLEPILVKYSNRFIEIYRNNGNVIYKVKDSQ